jgi:hypothetical protein
VIAVRYHDNVKVLQTIAPQEAASPFDRAQWYQLLAASSSDPVLVATAETDDALIALPLLVRNGRLEPLANWYSFTWRPLAKGDAAGLAEAIATDLRSQAGRVTLWPLPDEDGAARSLEGAFRKGGWCVTRDKCDDNHVLHVNARSFADYLSGRPGPLRTTLKRKAKKVSVEIFSSFHDDAWQIYEEIYANSWKPAEGDPYLLRAFARAEGEAGRIRLGIARHEGRPVAAQFWTVEAGTAWIHKLAHLEEAQPLSAGTTLTAALFEQVIDTDKVAMVDFGTGNDPYKRDWMEENRPRYRLDCHNPSRPGSWPHIARAFFQRLLPGASVARGPS